MQQEWFVRRVTVERHEKVYVCCPEPYPDVTSFMTRDVIHQTPSLWRHSWRHACRKHDADIMLTLKWRNSWRFTSNIAMTSSAKTSIMSSFDVTWLHSWRLKSNHYSYSVQVSSDVMFLFDVSIMWLWNDVIRDVWHQMLQWRRVPRHLSCPHLTSRDFIRDVWNQITVRIASKCLHTSCSCLTTSGQMT